MIGFPKLKDFVDSVWDFLCVLIKVISIDPDYLPVWTELFLYSLITNAVIIFPVLVSFTVYLEND